MVMRKKFTAYAGTRKDLMSRGLRHQGHQQVEKAKGPVDLCGADGWRKTGEGVKEGHTPLPKPLAR